MSEPSSPARSALQPPARQLSDLGGTVASYRRESEDITADNYDMLRRQQSTLMGDSQGGAAKDVESGGSAYLSAVDERPVIQASRRDRAKRTASIESNRSSSSAESHSRSWLLLFFDLVVFAYGAQVAKSIRETFMQAVILWYRPKLLLLPSMLVHACSWGSFFCIWLDQQVYFDHVRMDTKLHLLIYFLEMLGAFCMVSAI